MSNLNDPGVLQKANLEETAISLFESSMPIKLMVSLCSA